MKNSSFEILYRWQYPYIMFGSLALAFFMQSTNGLLITILLVYWALYGVYAFLRCSNGQFKTIFTILMVYVLFSVVEYLINGLPFKFYYTGFRGLFIPMMAVYIGMVNNDERVYKWLVLSTFFCVLVGLYLYFIQPSWYLSFKVNALADTYRYEGSNLSESNVMAITTSGRFSSFFPTSYNVAYYTTFSICILFCDIFKTPKNRLFKSNWLLSIILGVLIFGLLLTLTRVAIIYISILLLIYIIYSFAKKKKRSVRGVLLAMIMVVAVFFIIISNLEYGSFVIDMLENRLQVAASEDVSGGSRGAQIETVIASWNNFLLGEGMGSRGGAARAQGMPGITDNDWIRVLVEFGVVGIIIFIAVYVISIKRAYAKRSYMMTELTIVLYGLLSMIVADTMYKGDIVLIFWFAIGRIWNQNLYIIRLKNNNCI